MVLPVGIPPQAATLPLLIVEGEWTEARDLATVTRVHGSPLERQMAVTILGNLGRYQGNPAEAWAMVRQLVPRGPDTEPEDGLFPYAIEMLRLAASLALDASDLQSARNWIRAHDRWLDWSQAVRGRSESQLLWARLHQLDGHLARAEHCAREAVKLASDPRQPLALLAAHRSHGRISMDAQHPSDALDAFRQAISLADACAVPYERALTLVDLAELYIVTGRSKDASPILRDVRETAAELNARPLGEKIDELDARLASRAEAFQMTAREVDVLRLVAQGMTDAEVADRLSISPRTVGQHLHSIYNKLDVPSRAAATRVAVEHHLV